MTTRTVKVDVKADISDYNRKMLAAAAGTRAFASSLDSSRNQMAGLVQAGIALGPAVVGIGAAAVPAIAGLANQFAFAAASAGVMVTAFNGVGDALEAVNAYAIDPTDANLQGMLGHMSELGPAGRDFVLFLQDLRPAMQELQDVSQAGLFPGIEAGITSMMARAPEIESLFGTIAKATGDLIAEAGDNLADPRWDAFFDFLEREARPTLIEMGRTIGNFTEGWAELWMAFQPLTSNFSQGFLDMSRDFANWADGLSQTQGFQEFIAYIERIGPMAGDTLGAIGNAFVELVEAAAPVAEIALPMLEALFDALAAFLNTPFGPALVGLAAGIAAVSTALRFGNLAGVQSMVAAFRLLRTLGSSGAGESAWVGTAKGIEATGRAAGQAANPIIGVGEAAGRAGRALRTAAIAAGVGGGLAFAMSDLDDKMGLTNTTTLALAGSIAGVWGAAIGGGIGLALDLSAANDELGASMARVDAAANNTNLSIRQRIAMIDAEIAAQRRLRAEKQSNVTADTVGRGVAGRGGDFGPGSSTGRADAALRDSLKTKRELEQADQELAFAEAGLTGAMANVSQATRDQTYELLQNISSMNKAADAALTAFDAETRYREALKSANAQAQQNNAGIRGNSAAALANRSALSGLAAAWNQVADAGGASDAQMRRARSAFIAAATGMGVGADRARELADELLHIPSPKPKIDVQSNAKSVVARAKAYLASLKDKTVFIHVVRRLQGKTTHPGPAGKEWERWMGGRVPAGFADGGVVPGRAPSNPRVDNMWAIGESTGEVMTVRSGEWIINQTQSRNNDAWLRAINGGLNLGPFPGFAGGGRVGGGMEDVAAAFSARALEAAFSAALDGRRFALDRDYRAIQLTTRRG